MRKVGAKHTLLLLAAAVLFVLVGTITYSYMFKKSVIVENEFTPAFITCKVHEKVDSSSTDIISGEKETDQKTSIQVQNTGNIDAYLRIRFVSYWVDATGNIVGKASKMPAILVTSGWITGTDNTYYYKVPVSPEDFTAELLAEPIVLLEEDGYYQVLEVFADGIQSKPANAASASWGVTIDDQGNITSVP